MKDTNTDRFPSYIPAWYRLFLIARKVYRQTTTRISEKKIRKSGRDLTTPDGEGAWTARVGTTAANPSNTCNKAYFWRDEDLASPALQPYVTALEALKKELTANHLHFTTAAGTFLARMFYEDGERTKLWENSWVLRHSTIQPGMRILDIGGASTIFSFYLAKIGGEVTVIDNDWSNCGMLYNANYVARKMGWKLTALDRDAAKKLPFPDNYFDRVFSICVLEHLTSPTRQAVMREIGRVVKPGGLVGLTVDYDHERPVLITDKGLRFGYPKKLSRDVIGPSELSIHGNTAFSDPYPEKKFVGALFLQK